MLYVLTGGIQTGKTRWLERRVAEFQAQGVYCAGVISPGIWRKTQDADGSVAYEKLGIESVLLPEGKRSVFSWRRDIAQREAGVDECWQSSQAKLGWAIPDEALAVVNGHFDALAALEPADGAVGVAGVPRAGADGPTNADDTAKPAGECGLADAPRRAGLLIVDELGRLELERDGGFTSAVLLLERGPNSRYGHALVIARDRLAQLACDRFADAWDGARVISPGEQARQQLAIALGLTL